MRTIIFDSQAVGHASKHTMEELYFEGRRTGVIYGFLNQILSLSRKFKTDQFIFCWDSPVSFRKEIYPGYKERTGVSTPEEEKLNQDAFKQFDILREIVLPTIGFRNVFRQKGFEADDLIAWLVKNIRDRDFLMATDDKDLYQLLEYSPMYKLRAKKIYTSDNFREQYDDASPHMWKTVLVYAGCKGDKVQGIDGVGAKTALKYAKGKLRNSKLEKIKTFSRKRRAMNRLVTSLPFIGVKPMELKDDEFYLENILTICEEYGIYRLIEKNNLETWRRFCNGSQEW